MVKDPTSLKDKGNVYYKACDYTRAIECYSECVEKLETEPRTEENRKLMALVYSNRAMTLVKLNERGKAIEDCNKSIEYDPTYSKSYLRRADCLKKIGKYKDALKDYQMLIKLTPDDKAVESDMSNL